VTSAVHANGGRIFAQLMHSGRVGHVANVGHHPVAPSAVALRGELFTAQGLLPAPVPHALSTAEVADEVQVFADAARRAVDAGFDGIELHGANGYLIQQFLSSNANRRTDGYGRSIAGRIRFAVEVAEAVADAIGPDRVGIRLSPGGQVWDITEEDVPRLYGALVDELARLDLAYVHTMVTTEEDLLVALRRAWPNAFMVNPSGGIGPVQADQALGAAWLARGADLISFGRAFIANPDLVERFRTGAVILPADPDTFYQGGDTGYIDHAAHRHDSAA
jgi:N-ethylmaleimide reductase